MLGSAFPRWSSRPQPYIPAVAGIRTLHIGASRSTAYRYRTAEECDFAQQQKKEARTHTFGEPQTSFFFPFFFFLAFLGNSALTTAAFPGLSMSAVGGRTGGEGLSADITAGRRLEITHRQKTKRTQNGEKEDDRQISAPLHGASKRGTPTPSTDWRCSWKGLNRCRCARRSCEYDYRICPAGSIKPQLV